MCVRDEMDDDDVKGVQKREKEKRHSNMKILYTLIRENLTPLPATPHAFLRTSL